MAKNKYQLEHLLGNKNNNTYLDKLIKYKNILTFFPAAFIAFGAILVFIYCFFYINYIPSGLNIGDSLNYIFISLGFGWRYFLFIFIHFGCVFFISHKMLLGKHEWLLYVIGFALFLFIILIYYSRITFDFDVFISIFFYFFIIYSSFYFFYNGYKLIGYKWFFIFLSFLCLFFPLLRIEGVLNSFLDNTLSNLGVKVYDSSIRLSDEEFFFVRKIADEQDVDLKTSCNIFDKNKLIHDVDILWSIGRESLIEISGDGVADNRRIKLTINNDNMKPIAIDNPKKCIFKEFRNIFPEGVYSISDNDEHLYEINRFISKHNNLERITVYGISDLKPYKKKGNKKLSEERAQSIKEHLSKNSKYKLSTEGLANFEYLPYCKKNILDEKDLRDCEGFNRGVILKLELKQDNTENEAVKNETVKNETVKNETVKNEVVTNDYDHYNRVSCCR